MSTSSNPNETPESFGVSIVPCKAASMPTYWRVRRVRVLPGSENKGNHHIYIDAYNVDGSPYRNINAIVDYTYGSVKPRLVLLDKPLSEPGGNEPMYLNQVYSVAMYSIAPSESVEGMHTKHADGEPGNTMGHWSFHVEFQLTPVQPETPPPAPTPTPTPAPTPTPTPGDAGELANIKAALNDMRSRVRIAKLTIEAIEEKLNALLDS